MNFTKLNLFVVKPVLNQCTGLTVQVDSIEIFTKSKEKLQAMQHKATEAKGTQQTIKYKQTMPGNGGFD